MWNQNAAIFEIYIQVITTIYNAQQTTRVFPTREKGSVWKDLLVHTLITENKYRRNNRMSQNYLEDNCLCIVYHNIYTMIGSSPLQ